MTKGEFEYLQAWYERYYESFLNLVDELAENIKLKKEHTFRVMDETEGLCRYLKCEESDRYLAKTIALFHDVGRFEQFQKYRTFLDLKSVNHAQLAVEILDRNNVLHHLNERERKIIKNAILMHNRKEISSALDERSRFFAKIIRDSDKLDIWRIILHAYQNGSKNDAIHFGLPDLPEFSQAACESIFHCKIVEVNDIRTVNDFKLLIMSWVFDLNFVYSVDQVYQRKYIDDLGELLPDGSMITSLIEHVKDYMKRRMKNNDKDKIS